MSVSVISGKPPMYGRAAGNHSPATKDALPNLHCEGVIRDKREAAAVEETWDGKKSPTDLDFSNLLADLIAGEKPKPQFIICEVNVYSAAPENLVGGRRPAPGIGHGKEASYYFFCLPAPGTERRRNRNVGGGVASERRMWHPETVKQIRSADGKSVVAYKRTLSYRISCPPGQETPTSSGMLSTGWIMIEISLKKKAHNGAAAAAQKVLCVIYKSKRKYAETSAGSGTPPIEQGRDVPVPEVEDAQLCSAGGDMLTPAPVTALPISPVSNVRTGAKENTATNLLLQASEKAVSCNDFKNACEMKKFVDLKKELILSRIDMLRSIVSDSFHNLEVRLQHVALERELTPTERDLFVSCGEDMSATMSSYFNDFVKGAQQDFHALESYVHEQVSQRASRVMKVPLVIVHDTATKRCEQVLYSACLENGFVSMLEGAENEFLTVPENSSAAASCSGVKRKADHDHPKAPTGVRQQRVAEGGSGHDTAPDEMGDVSLSEDPMEAGGDNGGEPEGCSARLQEGDDNFDDVAVGGRDQAMPQSLLSENDTMPVGAGNGEESGAGVSEVQHEQHGVAQVAEGTALDVDFLFSADLMDSGGDNGGCPDSCWTGLGVHGHENLESTGVLLVGGGEQAMPDCPDETEHQLPQDNDLTAVGADNIGDPSEIFRRILNEKEQIEPIRDDGSDLARLCSGMPQNDHHIQAPDGADDDGDCTRSPGGTILDGDDYPGLFNVDEYTQTPIDFAEPELQQVVTDGGSALDDLLEVSPDELLGPSSLP